ncbi:MAG TPA: metal-dependent hydrolase [bacterium]|nr:metal-dependent hydrolase [bacterium]
MEPITHLSSGYIIYNLFSERFNNEKNRFRNTIIIASIFPDIDALTSFISFEFSLIHHRGITHSIFGAFFLAFFLTFIFFHKKEKFWQCYFFSLLTLFIHIFLDLITSYGTQILLPFSNKRFSLNLVFIIDFLYTLPLLFFLLLFLATKKRLFLIIGFIYIFFYPLLNFISLIILKDKYYSLETKNVYFVPVLFTPINWRIIIDDDGYYKTNQITEFSKFNNSNEKYKKANFNDAEINELYK